MVEQVILVSAVGPAAKVDAHEWRQTAAARNLSEYRRDDGFVD
jgi:hypothetical protein